MDSGAVFIIYTIFKNKLNGELLVMYLLLFT